MANGTQGGYGWGIVVLAMIFFWPVGLVLLILKLSDSKKLPQNKSGTTSSIFSETVGTMFKAVEKPTKKSISCSGCGAPNVVISNQNCVCEYCGKPLA